MAKEQETDGDQSYFDGLEGAGLDALNGATATAYLSIVQPQSKVRDEENLAGSWRNTATGENYGSNVRVIPLAMQTVWVERDSEPPFMTVAVHKPHSFEPRIERPKTGKRGFPKMFNPETGYEIKELFTYAVMLDAFPEAGILYFTVPVSSMRSAKQWNSLLRTQRLPNGKLAPLFAFSWDLALELFTNSMGNENARIGRVTRGNLVSLDLWQAYVQPGITAARDLALLTAPEDTGSDDEE